MRFAAPKSISNQSVLLGDSYAVQRLRGSELKLTRPSIASATLSKREVYEADARGNSLSPALKARLPVGIGAGSTAPIALPHASSSVKPVRLPDGCFTNNRSFSTGSSGNRMTFARWPVGLPGERACLGTV